ncbi:hypothetical protein JCM1840_002209 [Sporobolomyces johnsonii]
MPHQGSRRCSVSICEVPATNQCSGCKAVFYCSKEHQASDWTVHKAACRSISLAKPYIVHFDLKRECTDESPWIKPFLDQLQAGCANGKSYYLVDSRSKMLQALDHRIKPQAVLCTSAGIGKAKCADLRTRLKQYIEAGGRLVLGGQLSNFLRLDEFNPLFASFGVSWRRSDYFRTTQELVPSHPLLATLSAAQRDTLASSYSAKAVMLEDVPLSEVLYIGAEDDFPRPSQSPQVGERYVAVAAAKVGNGWFAYLGDVNQEAGTSAATLVLLGV